MHIAEATNREQWDAFVAKSRFAPFLQAWAMGEVYREVGQEPIRLEIRENGEVQGICQAIVVPARRGRHVMVQYGPLLAEDGAALPQLLQTLQDVASDHHCSFLRLSPFWEEADPRLGTMQSHGATPSPLHLLSEYTWYIPLTEADRWDTSLKLEARSSRLKADLLAGMRKTMRNLIRRAEREGVEVAASDNPVEDLDLYFALQEETRKRHKFVPYQDSFIRAQVKHFAPQNQAIVYIARYQGEPLAASVHMNFGGVTSYHHGASTHKHPKVPASYLLQWTAISEALERGDQIYNFWGIAPKNPKTQQPDPKHPFAGVTTFKTGFGGKPLPLVNCQDIPITSRYYATRAFEYVRKWRRGF